MMYHSVTVQFSLFRISNFNTDIDGYINTRNLKKKQPTINVSFFFFAKHTASANQNVLK